MLLLINRSKRQAFLFACIQIHLMLLLIHWILLKSIDLATIQIHLMLLLIVEIYKMTKEKKYSNTSYVIINPFKN
nr:MAG TPA: hypothetical protein [Bacteriophage sp.]